MIVFFLMGTLCLRPMTRQRLSSEFAHSGLYLSLLKLTYCSSFVFMFSLFLQDRRKHLQRRMGQFFPKLQEAIFPSKTFQ